MKTYLYTAMERLRAIQSAFTVNGAMLVLYSTMCGGVTLQVMNPNIITVAFMGVGSIGT